MLKKEYTKGDLTIIWQPDLCIHSGVCFHSLPKVFKPRDRPWIQPEAADSTALIETVNACPSGALSIKNSTLKISTMESSTPEITIPEKSKVKVFENGPVRVLGHCEITLADGTVVEKPNGISFCRCGGSSNLPFCDASHRTNGFKG
ncbi:MAG: (4Fe-4S)-binding protein [Saprospiraceae bacterium]|nr:(4Fe-4S)-binding protein [Saprospiraceae bacterium]